LAKCLLMTACTVDSEGHDEMRSSSSEVAIRSPLTHTLGDTWPARHGSAPAIPSAPDSRLPSV
jgi:hypothetical protein